MRPFFRMARASTTIYLVRIGSCGLAWACFLTTVCIALHSAPQALFGSLPGRTSALVSVARQPAMSTAVGIEMHRSKARPIYQLMLPKQNGK